MKKVELVGGWIAYVDDEDYDKVMKYKWYKLGNYAATTTAPVIFMHDLVNPPKGGLENHHKNDDGLYNNKDNLVLVTRSVNHLLAKKQRNNTSGFKGVTYHVKNAKWVAHIRLNGKLKYLGSFNTPEGASKACENERKKILTPTI